MRQGLGDLPVFVGALGRELSVQAVRRPLRTLGRQRAAVAGRGCPDAACGCWAAAAPLQPPDCWSALSQEGWAWAPGAPQSGADAAPDCSGAPHCCSASPPQPWAADGAWGDCPGPHG
ncbi:hypothetical protein ACFQ0G_28815 [Streptomyces chiangmaiensis]